MSRTSCADPRVRMVDYGIRGMHLAYDLLDGCEALVLVDAAAEPGRAGHGARLRSRPRKTLVRRASRRARDGPRPRCSPA